MNVTTKEGKPKTRKAFIMKNIKRRVQEVRSNIGYTEAFICDELTKKAYATKEERGGRLISTKEEEREALNKCFESLICDLTNSGFENIKVTVWNRDPVHPANIEVSIVEALKDTLEGLLARCTKKVDVNNAIAKVVDLTTICCTYIYNETRDEVFEEERREAMEEVEKNIEAERRENEEFESKCETKTETILFKGIEYTRTYKVLKEETQETQNEDKTEETTSEAPDTTAVTEPQTEEEYVQPAWKRILAELDKRREAEKVCVDIS